MTGDSDNEIGHAGDAPAPFTDVHDAGGEPVFHPKPFRSWASAHEDSGPSLWSRAWRRMAGMFKRDRDAAEIEPADAAGAEPAFDVPTGGAEPDVAAGEEDAGQEPVWHEAPVDAGDEVVWLEAAPVEETASGSDADEADAVGASDASADEAETDIADSALEEPFVESGVSEHQESFATVDDALPADERSLAGDATDRATDHAFGKVDGEHDAGSAWGGGGDAAPLDTEPVAPKRGFFARLFGRKPKPVPLVEEGVPDTDEHPFDAAAAADALDVAAEQAFPIAETADVAEAPAFEESEPIAERAFDSMDQALPDERVDASDPAADESLPWIQEAPLESEASLPFIAAPPADASAFGDGDPAPRPKRPSLIARLFGKKEKAESRPSLEIEIHEDRIEAAVHALDHDDADLRFAPPASPASPAPLSPTPVEAETAAQPDLLWPDTVDVESQDAAPAMELETAPPDPGTTDDSRPTMEFDRNTVDAADEHAGRPTIEVDHDSRPTMEVEHDSRPTMEVEHDARSTLEMLQPAEAAVPDFGETLELEEKTDEFEIVAPPVAAGAADVEADTLETSKRSFLARLFGRGKTATLAPATGTVVEGHPHFLFAKFRAFYNEIIRFKHQKSEFTAGFATAIVTDYTADLSPDAAAEAQSKKLAEILELQAAEARWMGGEAGERYPDAQYAMAALADEMFAQMEWEGRESWPKHLVEIRLFRTHAADVEVFRRMDKLLKDKPNTPAARDMARVYLLVIAAGFQGKYRPFGLTRALADYRQRLYEFIHAGDPLMLYADDRRIFPEAVSRTLEGSAVSRFSAAQRWAAILVFLVTAYAVVAHMAWNRVSADLKDVTARIQASGTTAGVR